MDPFWTSAVVLLAFLTISYWIVRAGFWLLDHIDNQNKTNGGTRNG